LRDGTRISYCGRLWSGPQLVKSALHAMGGLSNYLQAIADPSNFLYTLVRDRCPGISVLPASPSQRVRPKLEPPSLPPLGTPPFAASIVKTKPPPSSPAAIPEQVPLPSALEEVSKVKLESPASPPASADIASAPLRLEQLDTPLASLSLPLKHVPSPLLNAAGEVCTTGLLIDAPTPSQPARLPSRKRVVVTDDEPSAAALPRSPIQAPIAGRSKRIVLTDEDTSTADVTIPERKPRRRPKIE
jgi:hypothetical protein